jgi:hypothetical protein
MKFYSILLILVMIFWGVSAENAEIYTWTDENGVRHYGDSPPEDAEDARAVFPEYQFDESADEARTAQDQNQLKSLIQEIEAEDATEKAEARKRAEEAEKNRKPTQAELVAAEKERLEKRIAFLEEQPLSFFGSQRNKIVRIGYYRYRMQELLEDPDKYFKQPASFEGNVKNPVEETAAPASGTSGN